MWWRLNNFSYSFSLQVGVVFLCCFGLVLHTIAFMKLCYNTSPEPEIKYKVASYVTASVFIIIGYIVYIIGLFGATLEDPALLKVSGWFLVCELFYWCVLTSLSFTGKCYLVRSVCVDNRCGERLYIQNGNWRTPILICTDDVDNGDGGSGGDDEKSTKEPGTSPYDILPVRYMRFRNIIPFNSSTIIDAGIGINTTTSRVDENQIGDDMNPTHSTYDEEKLPLDEQIRILLRKLGTIIGNLSKLVEPKCNQSIGVIGQNTQNPSSSRNESREMEIVGSDKIQLNMTEKPTKLELRQRSEHDTIKKLDVLEKNTTHAQNQTINQMLLEKSITRAKRGVVWKHLVNSTGNSVPNERDKRCIEETCKIHVTEGVDISRDAKRMMGSSAQLKQSQFIKPSYNKTSDYQNNGTWVSKGYLNELSKVSWYDLNQGGQAIPILSTWMRAIFPREVRSTAEPAKENSVKETNFTASGIDGDGKLKATESSTNKSIQATPNIDGGKLKTTIKSTNKSIQATTSIDGDGKLKTTKSSTNKSIQAEVKNNRSASGQRGVSEFEPIDDDLDSKQMLDKSRKEKGAMNAAGRAIENVSLLKNPEGGNGSRSKPHYDYPTTVNSKASNTLENSNTSTVENGNRADAHYIEHTNTPKEPATLSMPIGHWKWTPIGNLRTLPHFVMSIVYAILVLIFWYIYPILVIFSFAEELNEEEEERFMAMSVQGTVVQPYQEEW